MKNVIIVSKCLRVTKFDSAENWYHFHFKGVCGGQSLQKVLLRGRKDCDLKSGQEYVLYVQKLSMEKGILRGLVIKSKALEECWDKS